MAYTLGSCLECYATMEQCLFAGQCTPADKKYVTVETLRKLIVRDCPIRNAGPCPKAKPVPVPDCTCICPDPECTSTSSTVTSTSTTSLATTTMKATTTMCPICVCPEVVSTTQSSCEVSLSQCKNSLQFSGVSKSGAQGSRDDLTKELAQLRKDLLNTNLTKMQYFNKSVDLTETIQSCLEDSGNFSGLYWVLKAQLESDVNVTELWIT